MQEKNRRNLAKIVIVFLGILTPSFIFLGLLKGPIYSATSDTVNLQGKIVRNDTGYEGLNVTAGNPSCVVTGAGNDTCDFRIRYYDASTAGNLLLTEQFSNIEIGQYLGVFNLSLGSDPAPVAGVYSSFSALIQGEDSVYVEVGFDPSGLSTYTEVFSRMPLEATAYAVRAKYADNATGATELPWSGLKDPTADLTIEHTTRKTLFNWATGTGTNDLFSLTSNASANGTGALMNIQTGTGASLMPFRVRAGSVEGLMVDNQGRVGVGTTSPGAKLGLAAATTAAGGIDFGGDVNLYRSAANVLKTDDTFNAVAGLQKNGISAIAYGDLVYNNETFLSQYSLQMPEIWNLLHRAESRFAVSLSGFSTSSLSALFDGNFDQSGSNVIPAGGTAVVTVDFSAKGEYSTNGVTYPQGYVYIHSYKSSSPYTPPDSVSGRYQDRDGVWRDLTDPVFVGSNTWRLSIPANPYMVTLEISIVGDATDGSRITEVDYFLTRQAGAKWAIPNKYQTEKLYSSWTWNDSSNVAKVQISPTTSNFFNSGNFGIGTTSPYYKLDVSNGTGIVGRFSGRVIGADAVNTNEFVTKSQLDSIGGSITTYWQRTTNNLSPLNANDNVLPNTGGDLGASGTRWTNIYGATGDFTNLAATTLTGGITGNSQNITGLNNLTGVTGSFSTSLTTPLITNAGALTLRTTGANYMAFQTNSAERMRIDASGNVGIGITDPWAKLQVHVPTGVTQALRISSFDAVTDDTYVTLGHASVPKLAIIADGQNSWYRQDLHFAVDIAGDGSSVDVSDSKMMIDGLTGNVGIGTTNPSQLLHISETDNTVFAAPLYVQRTPSPGDALSFAQLGGIDIGGVSSGSSFLSKYSVWDLTDNRWESNYTGTAAGPTKIDWNYNGDINFQTMEPQSLTAGDPLTYNNTLVLKGNGNVGIGTTSPSYKLDVSGTGIVGRFSGRVIGANAVNTNEFVTKSQLDTVGGTVYWQRTSPNLSPINANDNILPNTSGNLGAAGSRWGTIYGNTGSFGTLEGNSTLTLQPSADGQDAVRIVDKTTLTSILSVDTLNSMVGIGTESPDSALHVAGQVKIADGTQGSSKILTSDINGLASWSDLSSIGGVVTSIIGTANQITADVPTGDVTLSIPSDFRAPGTVNAVSGIYTGATAGTQRIDASGNLLNIGDITFTAAGVTLDTDSLSPNILSLASGDSFNLVSGSLQVGGTQVITSGRLVRAANGSATAPAFSFSADTNTGTGMYSGGTDILKFATAGADRVTVLADGKVGVGTTSPGKTLDVAGDIRLRGDTATLNFYRATSPTDIAYIKYDEVGTSFDIATNNRNIRFLNKETWGESMRITSGGSVGIGTPSPVSLFSVGATSQFQVDSSGDIVGIKGLSYTWPTAHTANGYLKNNGTGGLSWAEVNAVQSTRITTDGNQAKGPVAFWSGSDTINSANGVGGMYWDDTQGYLGIGTDTPSAPLDIAGGTGGSLIKNSSGNITIEPAANLIISQGDVGIGTSSPLAKLHVKGNQILLKNEANADLGIILDSGSTATYRDTITFRDRGTDIFALEKTSTNAFQLYDYAGTGVSRILVGAGGNSGISMRTTGTGDFSFINDTTTRVTIKSDGNVGIGTTGPLSKLSVGGVGNSLYSFYSTNATTGGVAVFGESTGIGSIGVRGIGTSYGVYGDVSSTGSGVYGSNSGSGTGVSGYTSTGIGGYFAATSTGYALITGAGNVGIGTPSPEAKLHIAGTGDGTELLKLATERPWTFRQTSTGATTRLDLHSSVSDKHFDITSPNGNRAAAFGVSDTSANTRVFLVPDGGKVGIGTTAPGDALGVRGGGIQISNTSSANYIKVGSGVTSSQVAYIDFIGDTTYTGYGLRLIRWNGGANATSQLIHRGTNPLQIQTMDAGNIDFSTNSTLRMFISSEGITGTTAGSYMRIYNNRLYYYSSSERYKDNIELFDEDFSKILDLEPKIFTDKTSKERNIGFIAEELEALGLTHLIGYNDEGLPDTVEYQLVTLYNLGVLKEHEQSINSLELNANELLERVENLEAQLDSLNSEGSSLFSAVSNIVAAVNNTYDLGTTQNRWKDIYAQGTINLGNTTDNGGIKYDTETKRLKFTNDGQSWIPLGPPKKSILLSAQYPGSVILDNPDVKGIMTTNSTDIDNNSMNYYEWVSVEDNLNTNKIKIRYQIPSDFKQWGDGGITFKYATESTNAQENKLDLYVYDQASNVPETISLNHVSSVEEKWESVEVLGLPFNKCSTPGDVCIFVIEMSSSKDYYTRVGDVEIRYERNL